MVRTVWPRVLASLLLVLFSLGSVSAAEPPKERKRPSLGARLLETIESILPPVLAKSRGTMDPNGTPAPLPPETTGADSDSRGTMDPDG